MHTVKSKYKNPDMHIAKLKAECKEAWAACRRNQKRQGQHIAHHHQSGLTLGFEHCTSFKQFNPGDTVMVLGTIRKVEACAKGNSSIGFDNHTVRMIKERDQ